MCFRLAFASCSSSIFKPKRLDISLKDAIVTSERSETMTKEFRENTNWITWITGAAVQETFNTFEDACQNAKSWANAIVEDYPPPRGPEPGCYDRELERERERYDETHEIIVITESEDSEGFKQYITAPPDLWQVREDCEANTDPAVYARHIEAILDFDALY